MGALPGYRAILEMLRSTDDRIYSVYGVTGSGKSLGAVAAILQHFARIDIKGIDQRLKVLLVSPTIATAESLYATLSQAYNHHDENFIGIVTGKCSAFSAASRVLIVTSGVALIIQLGQSWITHLVLVSILKMARMLVTSSLSVGRGARTQLSEFIRLV